MHNNVKYSLLLHIRISFTSFKSCKNMLDLFFNVTCNLNELLNFNYSRKLLSRSGKYIKDR